MLDIVDSRVLLNIALLTNSIDMNTVCTCDNISLWDFALIVSRIRGCCENSGHTNELNF